VIGADGVAELKRMIVDGGHRGRGIGQALIQVIETAAMAEGIRLIQLETGPISAPALRLYRGCGYRERGPFGDYPLHPHSLFMERDLRSA
jgi:putative acetyltransferase